MSSVRTRWFRRPRPLFVVGVLSVLIAVGLLVGAAVHNGRYRVQPVFLSLPLTAGSTATGSFVADVDEFYEVELVFQLKNFFPGAEKLVCGMEVPELGAVKWTALQGEELVARGSAESCLYVDPWSNTRSRALQHFQNAWTYENVWEATTGRGIGRFRGQAGVTYAVRAEVATTLAALNNCEPRLVVRINRTFWERYRATSVTNAGLTFLGLAVAVIALWCVAVVSTKLRQRTPT